MSEARASRFVPTTIAVLFAAFVVTSWRCPFRAITGVPCPTCGMTRALGHALRGDFAGATALHPLVWLVVPLLAALGVVDVVGWARTRAWGTSLRPRVVRLALLATATLIFVVWIGRFFGWNGGPAP